MTTVSEIFETMAYGPAPESDKQAREWLEKHAREFGLFIGGRWVKGESGESFDVLNPATTERLARVTGDDEHGHVERRLVPPPAAGVCVVLPGSFAAAEHASAHYNGAVGAKDEGRRMAGAHESEPAAAIEHSIEHRGEHLDRGALAQRVVVQRKVAGSEPEPPPIRSRLAHTLYIWARRGFSADGTNGDDDLPG